MQSSYIKTQGVPITHFNDTVRYQGILEMFCIFVYVINHLSYVNHSNLLRLTIKGRAKYNIDINSTSLVNPFKPSVEKKTNTVLSKILV